MSETHTEPMTASSRRALRAQRLAAERAMAEQDRAVETMFPTADPYQGIEDKDVPQGELAVLAKEINVRFAAAARSDTMADNHRLSAAQFLAKAQAVCQEKKINFRRWCEMSVPQSYDYVRKLVSVGKSDNPAQALADLKSYHNRKNAEHRARKTELFQAIPEVLKLGQAEPVPPVQPTEPPPAPPTDDEPQREADIDRGNYFDTVDSLLEGFGKLSDQDKRTFLQLACDRFGAVVELP